MNIPEEDNIIKGLIAGDEEVINSFYADNLPKIKSYILNNSGSNADAEDVFQDALVFTYQKLKEKSLALNCSLTTYVYAVSRNLWMNTLRKRKKIIPRDTLPEARDILTRDALEELQRFERQSLFQKNFLKLGESCQKLLGFFFQGNSMREISEFMEYSEGYTRKKKFECKKQLLEIIEKDPLFQELRTDTVNN